MHDFSETRGTNNTKYLRTPRIGSPCGAQLSLLSFYLANWQTACCTEINELRSPFHAGLHASDVAVLHAALRFNQVKMVFLLCIQYTIPLHTIWKDIWHMLNFVMGPWQLRNIIVPCV